MNTFARLIQLTAVRIGLGALAAAATSLFGPVLAMMVVLGRGAPSMALLGIAGLAGLAAWWASIVIAPEALSIRPALRAAVLAGLISGTLSSGWICWGMIYNGESPWLFLPLVLAGSLLCLGTAGISSSGPNNSSKPTPLRGAA